MSESENSASTAYGTSPFVRCRGGRGLLFPCWMRYFPGLQDAQAFVDFMIIAKEDFKNRKGLGMSLAPGTLSM